MVPIFSLISCHGGFPPSTTMKLISDISIIEPLKKAWLAKKKARSCEEPTTSKGEEVIRWLARRTINKELNVAHRAQIVFRIIVRHSLWYTFLIDSWHMLLQADKKRCWLKLKSMTVEVKSEKEEPKSGQVEANTQKVEESETNEAKKESKGIEVLKCLGTSWRAWKTSNWHRCGRTHQACICFDDEFETKSVRGIPSFLGYVRPQFWQASSRIGVTMPIKL